MDATLTWIFWVSVVTLAYVYVGFGILVVLWGSLRRQGVEKVDSTPSVTLIVAAYNEESSIQAKLDNALGLDYPKEALEIIVGSDGSDDDTESIANRFAGQGVRVLRFPRRGKIHVLNDCVTEARGEILVFSDANTLFHPLALRMLTRNFADRRVGGVCGNQLCEKRKGSDSSGAGERTYWRYDKWLKTLQTKTGSIVAADGAIYAIRRDLYHPPPNNAVTDDFAISTGVIEQGFRLVFENEAIGYEPETGLARQEFGRKVRIIVRGLTGVMMRRRLLNPFRHGFYSIVLFSQKLLRRLAPVFLIGLFGVSLALAGKSAFFGVAGAAQGLFYLLASVGWWARTRPLGHHKLFSMPFYYCLVNGAALVALVRLSRGTRIERWQPQRRAWASRTRVA